THVVSTNSILGCPTQHICRLMDVGIDMTTVFRVQELILGKRLLHGDQGVADGRKEVQRRVARLASFSLELRQRGESELVPLRVVHEPAVKAQKENRAMGTLVLGLAAQEAFRREHE